MHLMRTVSLRTAPARCSVLVAVLALALALASCSGDDSSRSADPEPPGGDSVPPEVAAAADDWPVAGRDYRNTRAVPESGITTATVEQLDVKWRAPLEGFGSVGNAATTPLILGDRVVVQSLDSTVRVFDRTNGEMQWERTVEGGINIGPNGVAVGYGRVYATKGMQEVFALALESGEELWSTEVVDTETAGIDIQPQVADGLVLVSTVPVSLGGIYTGGDRGMLVALDADTGEEVWRFDTVEGGEELWGNPNVNSGGGAWYTPTVDVDAGIVYWGIANPAPFPGTEEFPNGSSRPGPNLYTDSVVALDLRSGELLWYRQVFPHDLLDRDHVHTMLVDTPDGTTLVSTGKGGIVFGHDVETGEILWETPVGIHRNDDLRKLEGPTDVWPGTYGGVLTPPSSADGVVYVATLNAPTEMSPDVTRYIGSELGTAPGEVAAVDAENGELLWSTEVAGDPLGGATVIGDLVFTATYQGRIYALARATGEIVWEFEAPGGINGWPALAGDLLIWPIGMSDPAMLLALTPKG